MSLTDKEIALELTKSYIEHLNERIKSKSITGSHANAESISKTFKYFYSTVENCGKSAEKE
ncbi:hypothetical protein JCM9152_3948 [Halalkalibacter hemicellulosilyticusJCM 9152]|uniref:Uncharacterized protein n=1 Tax=Halalkalibacter hemicellulosilyticusJCM 9152 TaxID=1236971 RepID=W4QM66_9BACI|nr:hypothetical protein JCM9152_3948 [Halalkalibacter hemicellulosilyticusJCM 9152]